MNKLDNTKKIIANGIKAFPKGMVCWSGGKDSMALLHIMKSMGINMPLIFFREQWQPRKYIFADDLIKRWNLLVYTWHPQESSFQQAGDEFEVQNVYQINSNILTCPTGIVEPLQGCSFTCSLDILKRPKQLMLEVPEFDALWIGHKGSDTDTIVGGDVGTRIDSRIMLNQANAMFPLRDWSHDDVWDYIERYDVPYDSDRYEKAEGKWREKADKAHNVDYVHACTRCVDRRANAPKFVHCPKLDMTIENISGQVPWASQEKLTYMKD